MEQLAMMQGCQCCPRAVRERSHSFIKLEIKIKSRIEDEYINICVSVFFSFLFKDLVQLLACVARISPVSCFAGCLNGRTLRMKKVAATFLFGKVLL